MRNKNSTLLYSAAFFSLFLAAGLHGEEDPTIKGKPLSHWVKNIQSTNKGLQMRASKALSEADEKFHKAIVPPMVKLLSSDRQNTRFPVAQVLANFGSVARAAVPHLLPMLKGTQYERNRASAAVALGSILKDAEPSEEVENVTKALVAVFDDDYEDVRRDAATACGKIGPAAKYCVPHLEKMLKDKEWGVRGCAAWSVGRLGSHATVHIDLLISMMHSERDIATSIVWAIGELGPVHENVVPNVVDRLEKVMFSKGAFSNRARSCIVGPVKKGTIEEYQDFCFLVLAKMGPDAKPAVSFMERLLKPKKFDARSLRRALYAIKVVKAIGKDAKRCLPVVQNALLSVKPRGKQQKGVLQEFKKECIETIAILGSGNEENIKAKPQK